MPTLRQNILFDNNSHICVIRGYPRCYNNRPKHFIRYKEYSRRGMMMLDDGSTRTRDIKWRPPNYHYYPQDYELGSNRYSIYVPCVTKPSIMDIMILCDWYGNVTEVCKNETCDPYIYKCPKNQLQASMKYNLDIYIYIRKRQELRLSNFMSTKIIKEDVKKCVHVLRHYYS